MFNPSEIKASLSPLTGWRQNYDAAGLQIDANNLESESGQFYNDVHPLLTCEDLLSVAPDFEQLSGDAAAAAKFNDWLRQKTDAAIVVAVTDWMQQKVGLRTADTLLHDKILFGAPYGFKEFDEEGSKTVGLEIKPRKSRSLKTVIRRAAFSFETNTTFTAYLFQRGQDEPIESQLIEYTAGGQKWFDLNWRVPADSICYLCYSQVETATRSIDTGRATRDLHGYNFPTGKYYSAAAFSNGSGASQMLDFDQNAHTVGTNYGINLDMQIGCDYTEFVKRNRGQFRNAVALQVAVKLLREMAYNPSSRVNRNVANISRNEILYEIDGDTQGRKGGLLKDYEKAIASIQFDRNSIDEECLTCRKRSVRYGTI